MLERGLVATRERARALILAGQVTVNGQVVVEGRRARRRRRGGRARSRPIIRTSVAAASSSPARSTLFASTRPGVRALDVGASTGGFTDVLLRRGAASVVALDVGHGQLDWRLRNDPRVIVRERVNARALTTDDVPHPVDLVTIDVSFISLRHILPALPAVPVARRRHRGARQAAVRGRTR